MHLAYMDESGTDGHSPVVMVGALIIPVGKFGRLSMLHSTAIQQILPVERIEEFKEFHAHELYKGTDLFEGIDETKRFTAIQVLLQSVRFEDLFFIYSAADRKAFMTSPFGSMRPLHSAFHMCLLGIEDWATANHENPVPDVKRLDWKDTYLCIADDCDDKKLKDEFRKTYSTLRSKHPFVKPSQNRLWHSHDNMFFADSKDCLGVQLADLCSYFVKRHFAGELDPENFYSMFSERIICAKPKPEWDQYGKLFRDHLGV